MGQQDMTNGNRGAGHDQDRCGARCRGSGEPCRLPAGWGTDHVGTGACRKHFGSTRNHRAGALRVLAESQARAELARLGEATPVTDPVTLLTVLCGEARQWQQVCRAQLDDLGSPRYESAQGFEQLRAEISLYERALDRVERFCTSMARLDLDARLIRLSQQQGLVVSAAIERILLRLGHERPKRDPAVAAIVAAELHAATAELEH